MQRWPHSPSHQLSENGAYIVTAATYQKAPIFNSRQRLTLLCEHLFERAAQYGWQLQAWAAFPNHYHFVALVPAQPSSLRTLIRHLHSVTAVEVNRLDQQPGRKVWFQYWETYLIYEKSFYARLRYVHENAVHHGLVKRAVLYPWCSAGWFEQKAHILSYEDPGFGYRPDLGA